MTKLPADMEARTPAPEGEVVKSYGQKGRALYEAFWARNGDASPPPWDEQAHAIRAMWVNIARDAEPLYASPVVPVGVSEEEQRPLAEAIYRQVEPLLAECSEPNSEDYISAILAALTGEDHA